MKKEELVVIGAAVALVAWLWRRAQPPQVLQVTEVTPYRRPAGSQPWPVSRRPS